MKNYKAKLKIYFYFSLIVFGFFFFTFNLDKIRAATLYFEPQDSAAGTEKEFSVTIKIDSEKQVNAISVAISIPPVFALREVNDGNSIINFWLDKPDWDETNRLLTFSGIVPGGFSDKGGKLLVMKFKAEREGAAWLKFEKEKTEIFLNTAGGVKDEMEAKELMLLIVRGKENLSTEKPDYEPPETFLPEIGRSPDILEGKYFLVFSTQDKISGIDHYEIQENRGQEIENKNWQIAESPYLLKDQKLRSYIYVKAVDKAGNERIETVLPRHPLKWYENYFFWIIIMTGFILIWYEVKKFYKKNA